MLIQNVIRVIIYAMICVSNNMVLLTGVCIVAALFKCPKCGSTRLEPVKQAGGLAGRMGVMVYLCQNCGKESKIKSKK